MWREGKRIRHMFIKKGGKADKLKSRVKLEKINEIQELKWIR